MSKSDVQDEQIDTQTIWLTFEDGECAISVDLTRWHQAARQIRTTLGEKTL